METRANYDWICTTVTELPLPNTNIWHLWTHHMLLFTQGQFWPSGIVVACVFVCVCLSVCLSVCVSITCSCPRDNSGPVQARIAKFGPKMQKTLVKVPIFLFFFWGGGQLTLTFKVKFNKKKSYNLPHFEPVRTITYYPFKLGSPNLDQRWK